MSGARPRRLVFVSGTGTEVGKTWAAAAVLEHARDRGMSVSARKPAQSFDAGPASPYGAAEVTDAERLAIATGEEPVQVCPVERSYPLPMAPPMAAAALGRPVPVLAELVASISGAWGSGGDGAGAVDLGLVEGAGGVASPLAGDGDSADLARALGVDVVLLVADPRLGVINSVRLSVAALRPIPVVVYLNRFDPADGLQALNAAWLRDREGLTVTTSIEELLDALVGAG